MWTTQSHTYGISRFWVRFGCFNSERTVKGFLYSLVGFLVGLRRSGVLGRASTNFECYASKLNGRVQGLGCAKALL